MIKFKKVYIISLMFAISISIVSCSNGAANNDKNNDNTKIEHNIDFKNVEYNKLNLDNISLQYPKFLINKENTKDGVILSNEDKSITLNISQFNSDNSLNNIYNKDLKSLKNITYKYLGDTTYSISGNNGDKEYYKATIQNKNKISTILFTYPKENEKDFSNIIDKIYKSFIKNKRESNSKLQIGTVSTKNFNKNLDDPELILLGDYKKGKKYDIQYGKIIGVDVKNSNKNTINDKLVYNTVYFTSGSVNYPNFLKPGILPVDGKGISFHSSDKNLNFYLSYSWNGVLTDESGDKFLIETPKTELNSLKKSKNDILNTEIKGDYLYSTIKCKNEETGNEEIQFSIDYFKKDVIQSVVLISDYNYYKNNTEKINEIYNEMKKSYEPAKHIIC